MNDAAAIALPARSDPAVRRIAADWRRLTGGRLVRDPHRRTLLACSGGADSTAMVLALASAVSTRLASPPPLVVAHVVHDLRHPDAADADLRTAADLARRLSLPFVHAQVAVRALPGNAEAVARRLRYQALARLARQHGCQFIATAHHADDQLESMLIAMIRGAGPRGLAGVADRRRLAPTGPDLIRPMLGIDRAACERLCTQCGITWATDATNADTTRRRASIRHAVAPHLRAVAPAAAARAVASARLLADAARVIDDRAREAQRACQLPGEDSAFDRRTLAAERPIVIGQVLRSAAMRLTFNTHRDRLSASAMGAVVSAVTDHSTEPRRFTLAGVQFVLTARHVRITRSAPRA